MNPTPDLTNLNEQKNIPKQGAQLPDVSLWLVLLI